VDESSFERLINIQAYSDAELKALAASLSEEERELSMRRRLLHGELDIVRAEMVRRLRSKRGSGQGLVRDGDVAALTEILSGSKGWEDLPEE
jgi:RsiG-like